MRNAVVTRNRRLSLVMILMLLLPLVLPSMAIEAAPQDYGPWRGEYYDNATLTGAPKLVRTDQAIHFDWNLGSPDSSLPNDKFSARWTAFIGFDAGTYRFTAISDDGMRVWVDETLLLDRWYVQAASPHDFYVSLGAGQHYIRVEYYDQSDRATAKLSWLVVGGPSQPADGNWHGDYFDNPYLIAPPKLSRTDSAIGFNWGSGSPDPALPADGFSVRWTRSVTLTGGNYTLHVETDDGVRVWLDADLVIDRWFDQSAATYSQPIYIAPGEHTFRIEYYERTGDAVARFWWDPSSGPPPAATSTPVSTAVPGTTTVIVDDTSAGFHLGGPSNYWHRVGIGYGGSMYWTYNTVYQDVNYATWTPWLPGAGYYDVYAYIPSNYADTRNARYRIYHNGQRDDAAVGQYSYFNKWVFLGRYYFNGAGGEYVFLSDNTHETYASKRLGFDAVKFVAAGSTTTVWPTPYATPTPTAVPSYGCSITPEAGFGSVWRDNATVRSLLGCPIEAEKSIWSAEQGFQGGTMVWFEDTSYIYVLYNNGLWQSVADSFVDGQPESDPGIVAPWGYYQPIRGFGKAWREEPGVRDRLGWGTEEERGANLSRQNFEGGMMIWSPTRGVLVLYQDGTWQGFN